MTATEKPTRPPTLRPYLPARQRRASANGHKSRKLDRKLDALLGPVDGDLLEPLPETEPEPEAFEPDDLNDADDWQVQP